MKNNPIVSCDLSDFLCFMLHHFMICHDIIWYRAGALNFFREKLDDRSVCCFMRLHGVCSDSRGSPVQALSWVIAAFHPVSLFTREFPWITKVAISASRSEHVGNVGKGQSFGPFPAPLGCSPDPSRHWNSGLKLFGETCLKHRQNGLMAALRNFQFWKFLSDHFIFWYVFSPNK